MTQILPEIVSKIREQVISESKIREPKIDVKKESKLLEENQAVIHRHVTCDECGAFPITGIRYKCAVCPDFDVCEKCEAISTHDHPFLKIRKLKHTPLKILAIIEDNQEDSLDFNGMRIPIPGLS